MRFLPLLNGGKRKIAPSCTIVLILLWAATCAWGQGCPTGLTDTRYTWDRGSNSPEYPGDFPIFFRVARVVGPGTPGEFQGNGLIQPANWQTYLANGVAGKNAQVTLSASVSLPATYYALL